MLTESKVIVNMPPSSFCNKLQDNEWRDILQSAGKHPNSKVSKLIKVLEADRSQKNIIALLIEIYEHQEYCSDFGLSLKYLLNLFEESATDQSILNECGLLLLNSSKIYAKRVDFVYEMVQCLICSLSSSDIEEKKEKQTKIIEEPKRSRKRHLEPISEPCDIEFPAKKLRLFEPGMRFAKPSNKENTKEKKAKPKDENKADFSPLWVLTSILDIDDEEVESKKLFKFFTYHIRNRYYSLSRDVIFLMYYKMKDYIAKLEEKRIESVIKGEEATALNIPTGNQEDEEETLFQKKLKSVINSKSKEDEGMYLLSALMQDEEFCSHMFADQIETSNKEINFIERSVENELSYYEDNLPEHSSIENGNYPRKERGTHKFSNDLLSHVPDLEDPVLGKESNESNTETTFGQSTEKIVDFSETFERINSRLSDNTFSSTQDGQDDSGLGRSILETNNESAFSHSKTDSTTLLESDDIGGNDNLNDTSADGNVNDSTCKLPDNVNLLTTVSNEQNIDESHKLNESTLTAEDSPIDLMKLKVHLPHLDKDGVFFYDLDEKDKMMLSPAVIATDVFHCLPPERENISVIIDDEIRRLYDIKDPPETHPIPILAETKKPNLILNIFKIDMKFFKRRIIFKLGPEFDLYMLGRKRKRKRRCESPVLKRKICKLGDSDMTGVPMTPPDSPTSCLEFYGFPDEVQDKNRTISSDSGIELHINYEKSPNVTLDACDLNDCLEYNAQSNDKEDEALSPNCFGEVEASNKTSENHDSVVPSILLDELSSNVLENTSSVSPLHTDVYNNEASDSTREIYVNLDEIPTREDEQNSKTSFDATKTKVQKWHEYLQPILAKSKERHHFDVFEIGTNIIEQMQNREENVKSITFEDVMNNKDPSYVSRYFLSTLLLVNQNNINIEVNNYNSNKPSEWSDFKLQLLSTKRHTVSVEDNIGIISKKLALEKKINRRNDSTMNTII